MVKVRLKWLTPALALVLALALGGLAWAAEAVRVETTPETGKHLVDGQGRTLYYFTKDSAGQSVCQGDCLVKWPAFHSSNPSLGPGLNGADFGTITRPDGAKQTTFRGRPLYYFFQDKAPGDQKGHQVANVWFVVNPDTLK